MVSRRAALKVGVSSLAATAGCFTRTPVHSSPNDVDDDATTTPGDVPEWTPKWTMPLGDWHVLGLDSAGGLLYATLSRNHGPSAIAAIDPTEQSVLWQTESEGEAVGGSHATYQHISRDQWGVTLTDDTVYAVSGPAEDREWSAIHALDRTSGERRWSIQRERELAVAGVADGVVVATGLEFFPPPGTTPVSHQTPESPLSTIVYGIDAADGTVRWTREFVAVQDISVGAGGISVAAGDQFVRLGRDGTTQFTYDHGTATRVADAAERIFYLTGDGADAVLHGIAASGDAAWQHPLPVKELLVADDRLYAGDEAVVAVDADGTIAWHDADHGQWLLLDPGRDTLYTRSTVQADAATAYDVTGKERWTFDPPSNNAWPVAATRDAVVVAAITGDHADEPFHTIYSVTANGKATATLGKDTVFDAVGFNGTVYLADGVSNLVALDP